MIFASKTVYKLRGRFGDWKFEVLLLDVVIGIILLTGLVGLAITSGPLTLLAAMVAIIVWSWITLRLR